MPQRALLAIVAVVLGLGVWAGWRLTPSSQIGQNMRTLLAAAGARDWGKVGRLMSADYRDGWGLDRASALETAAELGGCFLTFEVRMRKPASVVVEGVSGRWKGGLELRGRGSPAADWIVQEAARLREDFVFDWRRETWKPWDWKLVSVSQPEIPAIP